MSINRPELFEMMGVPKAQASKMLDLVLNSITEALAKGEDVTLIGFGTFKVTELAERTGYTKTDNRYYWAEAGVFLSVDNYSERYPFISSYAYSLNNPLNISDPSGDTIKIGNIIYQPNMTYKGTDSFTEKTIESLNSLYSGGDIGKNLVGTLSSSAINFPIIKTTDANSFNVTTNEIFFNPDATYGGIDQNRNITPIPFVSLGHELAHGLDKLNGTLDLSTWSGNTTNAEKFATHIENQIRAEHGFPLRTHYGLINNNGVFSGDPATQLINGSGESLFYQSNITVNSPKMGSLMNDGRMFNKSWNFSVPYKYK